MSSAQTDIAVAVRTASGVVIWTDEAHANSGFCSSVTKHLFGFDIDIAVLIAPSRSPREADMVLDRLRQVAAKIGACDAVTVADAYELRGLALRHLGLTSPLPVDDFLGVPIPPDERAWNTVRRLMAGKKMGTVRAIKSAALLAMGEE